MGWMDLPLELLELIFQRLCLDDAMNCRATCRSWRKAADAIFSSQLPLMLSLSTTSTSSYSWPWILKSDNNNFGSLSAPWSNHDSTVLTEKWPQGINHTDNSVHSVQGWLMFNIFHYEWATGQSFSELSFFNPFSRARFKLPKLFLFSGEPCYYPVRVAFNSAPPGSEEFVVAFLCVVSYQENKKQRLAFIRFKQGSWIESIETDEIFYDIEVDDDNKLYGLTFKHGTSVVFVFTLGDNNHRDDHVVERLVMLNTIQDIDAVGRFIFSYASFKRSHQMVMDTTTGELLIVRHDLNASVRHGCYDLIRTKGFSVFKLDRSNLRWCEVFDIGDRFLFWDFTKVSLVSAKGLRLAEQFKRGNCIFFCHASTHGKWGKYLTPRGQDRFLFKEYDMGVFFLADRTISYFPINSSLPASLQSMWFSPAP